MRNMEEGGGNMLILSQILQHWQTKDWRDFSQPCKHPKHPNQRAKRKMNQYNTSICGNCLCEVYWQAGGHCQVTKPTTYNQIGSPSSVHPHSRYKHASTSGINPGQRVIGSVNKCFTLRELVSRWIVHILNSGLLTKMNPRTSQMFNSTQGLGKHYGGLEKHYGLLETSLKFNQNLIPVYHWLTRPNLSKYLYNATFSFDVIPEWFPVPDVGCFGLFMADISPRAVSQDIVNLPNEKDNSVPS